MHEPLEIRLLGPFEVLAGGSARGRGRLEASGAAGDARAPARPGGRRRRARRRPVGRGASGRSAQRAASSHRPPSRRARRGRRSSAPPTATPSTDARVDAVRFEELLAETRAALRDGDVPAAADAVAAALALWRGPALQGLTGTAWFGDEARRLEALRVDALEEQFEVALALGEHRELMPALRSALADNPFRERLWGQLMLALYRSGRQADALETFQEARRVLADELGLEPGPELRRLQEAILAHDPAIAAVPVDRRRRGNLPAPRRRSSAARTSSAEVAALLREHRLVTLTGPAGRRQEPPRARGGALARARVPGRHLARRPRARGRRGRTPFGSSRTPSTFAAPTRSLA